MREVSTNSVRIGSGRTVDFWHVQVIPYCFLWTELRPSNEFRTSGGGSVELIFICVRKQIVTSELALEVGTVGTAKLGTRLSEGVEDPFADNGCGAGDWSVDIAAAIYKGVDSLEVELETLGGRCMRVIAVDVVQGGDEKNGIAYAI
jgi:hypothetical protein